MKAKERADVTLQTGESPSNAKIIWTFGAENPNMRLATIKKRVVKSDYDVRFKDRLQLDSQTGALTITQLSVQDSGIYKWQAISDTILWKQFNLTVYCKYIRSLASLDLENNLIKRQHFFPTLIHEKMHNNSLLLLCLDTLASISPHF